MLSVPESSIALLFWHIAEREVMFYDKNSVWEGKKMMMSRRISRERGGLTSRLSLFSCVSVCSIHFVKGHGRVPPLSFGVSVLCQLIFDQVSRSSTKRAKEAKALGRA